MNENCRFCNAPLSYVFVDLGSTPLSNAFLDEDMLNSKEVFYPLKVFACKKCFLVQLQEFESPSRIFTEYAYFSSYSESWLKHAENYVERMINQFSLDNENFVVEIGSNDGYLLQYFKKKGINTLGIEPAKNIAEVAIQKGIPTLKKFFNIETANELKKNYKQADLIVGNNVLAHVPNLNDFVEGLRILLKPNGIITMEFPHLLKLIDENQFDTIYHEHFSYFSLLTVEKIFSSHNLTIFDVNELSTHGGSLRIYVKHNENKSYQISNSIYKLREREAQFGLHRIESYQGFSKKVEKIKKDLNAFLISAKKNNRKVVCYGAAAKGNTLLNYCGVSKKFILFAVDRNKHKQGLFLPGTHIPIKSPEVIQDTKPDYVLILAWNLKDEIMEQLNFIREWGGKFVVPIPEVKVYS